MGTKSSVGRQRSAGTSLTQWRHVKHVFALQPVISQDSYLKIFGIQIPCMGLLHCQLSDMESGSSAMLQDTWREKCEAEFR